MERNFSLGQESVLVRRKIQRERGIATSKLGKRAEPAKTRLDAVGYFSPPFNATIQPLIYFTPIIDDERCLVDVS